MTLLCEAIIAMKTTSYSLQYRLATIDDIPQIRELGVLAYGQIANQLSAENWEKMKTGISNDNMWHDLLGKGTGFLCCKDGGELVGMAFLISSGNPWDVFPENWCYLRMVGVHPQYGGMGIAQTLTQQCIQVARNNGESIIALHTSEVMNAARHIYEKLGFEIVKEIASRYEIRYWLYKMSL